MEEITPQEREDPLRLEFHTPTGRTGPRAVNAPVGGQKTPRDVQTEVPARVAACCTSGTPGRLR